MHNMRIVVVVMRCTEVNDLYSSSILNVKQHILRLKIPVSNILAMTVGYSLQDLLANVRCLVLRQMFTLTDFVEKLAAVA